MSLRQRYVKIVAALVPAGAAGLSLLLGSAAPGAAKVPPASTDPSNAAEARVSERLAAIREAVSVAQESTGGEAAHPGRQLAWANWGNGYWRPWRWGWGNGGPWHNWHNWPNWHNYWRNW